MGHCIGICCGPLGAGGQAVVVGHGSSLQPALLTGSSGSRMLLVADVTARLLSAFGTAGRW